MDLIEYEGKQLMARWGIPVPQGRLASTPAEAAAAADALGGRVVVKAQVRAGGRGKAGGVKVVGSPREAEAAARDILAMRIKGHAVEKVLVEEALGIEAEYYAAVTLDRGARAALFMVSSRGGMDIEEVAATDPDALARVHVDPLLGLAPYQVRSLVFGAGLDPRARKGATVLLERIYALYAEADATLVEVNPLVLTTDGRVLALDAKVSIDDSALYRHPDLAARAGDGTTDPTEREARARGLNFLKLDGDIGVIGNGAGLVMSTLDLIDQAGGRAANFLDVGGGAGVESLSNALEVILSAGDVRSVVVNIFGGITRCDLVAEGIADAVARLDVGVPIVVRLDGTNAEQGRQILAGAKHPMIKTAATMLEAARLGVGSPG
ncbi:MAG: ADP-forming succinate--CoA ligase subunit beta [Actinomycetota bacterium]